MPDYYCTVDDVNNLTPQVPFTATSKPPQATVNGFIDDIAREMDASMSNIGYVVPVVSGEKALQLLRRICAYGALGLAQAVRHTGINTATDSGKTERDNIWTLQYRARMKALCNPQDPFELPDAPRSGEQLIKQPDQVFSSFVQTVPSEDPCYDPDNPVVTRYQTL